MVRIIIFSDIRIYCEGLTRILSSQAEIEVIGADNSLLDAAVKVEQLMPHMILLDMTMPHSCGFAKQVTRLFPEIRIVAIAVPEVEQNVLECAEAGISGYVAREATIQDLITTVISAANGKFCCPPQIAAILFDKFKDLARKAKENCLSAPDTQLVSVSQGLTRREKQILGLMTNGLSNKEIAKALVIEVSTVKNHVHNILVKLEVHNRIQAVALLKREEQLNSIGTIDALRAGEAYC